jgi:hypothetical protein
MLLAFSLFLPVYSLFDPGEFTQLYSIAFPIKLMAILLAELVIYAVGLPLSSNPAPGVVFAPGNSEEK